MPTSFPWTTVLMFLGALQGVLLFAVLWHRRRRASAANRLLGVLMLLAAVRLFHVALMRGGLAPGRWDWTLPLILTFSPLLHLYCRLLMEPGFRLGRRQWLHFLPALLWTAGRGLAILVFPSAAAEAGGPASALSLFGPDLFWLVQTIVYLALILRLLRRHRQRAAGELSDVDSLRLSWIRWLAGAFAFLCGLIVFFLAGTALGLRFVRPSNAVLYVSIALIIYLWGYFGLRQPEIFSLAEVTPGPALAAVEKAAARKIGALEDHLLSFMEKRSPHLDPALTMHGLAEAMGVPAYQLTAVLNGSLGRSFFAFINARRVEEAKRKLADPAFDHLKILALALDSGFASKSAFNRVFKEMAGETPSAFRKRRPVSPPAA